jgi:ring-1,2-phenylacetyl-CoA epoxidase subunit PaaC
MPAASIDPHVAYVLRHADDNLVLAQRLGDWISKAPELEEDIALGNIGLDHLGQARALLQHAGTLEGAGRTEDDLAMLRTERQFNNALLVEQPNGDFAQTVARSFLFDAYQVCLWESLEQSSDPILSGIAAKAIKETRYHLRHSSTWVVRLGDGTDESHERMQRALDAMWLYTAELFEADQVDRVGASEGWGADPAPFEPRWRTIVAPVIGEGTLTTPDGGSGQRSGGRSGFHSEHLGHLLAEMQSLARAHPGAAW